MGNLLGILQFTADLKTDSRNYVKVSQKLPFLDLELKFYSCNTTIIRSLIDWTKAIWLQRACDKTELSSLQMMSWLDQVVMQM